MVNKINYVGRRVKIGLYIEFNIDASKHINYQDLYECIINDESYYFEVMEFRADRISTHVIAKEKGYYNNTVSKLIEYDEFLVSNLAGLELNKVLDKEIIAKVFKESSYC